VVYTLDRQTGEFLWATPTVGQNVISDIDGAGAVKVNPATLFTAAGQERLICPGVNGGKNWPAGAYSPTTNTMYYPLQNLCMVATSTDSKPSLKSLYAIATKGRIAEGTDKVGTVQAISAETGEITWKHEQRAGMLSLVATGGGLIFGGDASGRFRAFDQKNGKVLWETDLGAPVTGYPITFAVGGRQYVAASTGPSLVTAGLNALTPELQPGNSSKLFVFALPTNPR
jgi:alcohol dehydrogenase (cytochrome c)